MKSSRIEDQIAQRAKKLFVLADREARFAKDKAQVETEFDTSSCLRPPSPRSRRRRESLLARAFDGKLVPQDPADEPVENLLRRTNEKANQPDASRSN